MEAKESSTTKLYRPNVLRKEPEDDHGEWVTVKNPKSNRKSSDRKSKSDKVNDRKKRNLEYRLNKSINEFLSKQEQINDELFVTQLLKDKVQIKDENLKERVNKYLSLFEKNLETVKKARTFRFLNSMKLQTEELINKLNKVLNEENLHLLAGNMFVVNYDDTSLFTNEKYAHLKERYDNHLLEEEQKAKQLEEAKAELEKKNELNNKKYFDSSKSKIKTGTSFADLFKKN